MTAKRGKGRPKLALSAEQIKQAEAMAVVGCTNAQIATILGISESTLERRSKENTVIFDALERGRASAAVKVLKAAYDMASSGKNPLMTMFWLKCRLRWSEAKPEADRSEEDFTIQLNYKK
jgi:uncharacterized protein (DUF2384 family)